MPDGDVDSGRRQGVQKKGWNCRKIVSPHNILANGGVPVCSNHLEGYLADLDETEAVRLRLRAKYDPGPLPLDGRDP